MNILVAEDDRDIAELIGRYVQKDRAGRRTSSASGDDALASARKHPVDLAILDVMLPGHERSRRVPCAPRRPDDGAICRSSW